MRESDQCAGFVAAVRGTVWLRALIGVLGLVGALIVTGLLVATRPEPVRLEREEPVLTVRAVTVAPVDAPRLWTGYGTARSMNDADVSAEVGARVVERPDSIEAGMSVRRGDLLVRLDPSDYEHALASAEARHGALVAQREGLDTSERRWREQAVLIEQELTIVRAELERALAAREQNAANLSDVELRMTAVRRLERESASIGQQIDDYPFRRASTEAQIRDALAELETARLNLERTRVVSPIDGVLQEVEFRVGEMVQRGQRVARVVDLSRVEIPLLAPATAAADLAPGDAVSASPDAPGAGGWSGRVARVAPESDPSRRTITLFAEVEQDPAESGASLLRPGRFVVASVRSSASESRLIVPRRAVEEDHVLVAEPSAEAPGELRVGMRRVRVLYHLDGSYPGLDPLESQWSVVEGEVSPGDRVIVSNLDALAPGARVRIAEQSVGAGDGPEGGAEGPARGAGEEGP